MCSILGYKRGSIKDEDVQKGFEKSKYRGPDATRVMDFNEYRLMFHRLSIMGLDENGMQPFTDGDMALVCNGEIYDFRPLKEELINKGYTFKSGSDCEILIPMFKEYGTRMFEMINGEYAMILYDGHELLAARDPIGIRPLFYGYLRDGSIIFSSIALSLVGLVEEIIPFPIGSYYYHGEFHKYIDLCHPDEYVKDDRDTIYHSIHDLLIKGIKRRMDADAPVGFLLSGGLDSSLVSAIGQKCVNHPIKTYAIGMVDDAIDLKYARMVADYIGSEHHEFYMTRDDVVKSLDEVIKMLGTYDITTIRASIGMYLCVKKIHETFDTRVLLTGEISDELFGYKYTDYAPDAKSFEEESVKRIEELYMYDVLRADRSISSNSIEARVPFGDVDFVRYVMSIDPELKMNRYGKGKYLLRKAFEDDHLLPDEILWREKAAFSDAVGHSMVDDLKKYAEGLYTDEEYEILRTKYTINPPFTKESLLYREIFEKYYPHQGAMIKDFWMPNKSWEGCDVNDPSARVLKNYGDSGK